MRPSQHRSFSPSVVVRIVSHIFLNPARERFNVTQSQSCQFVDASRDTLVTVLLHRLRTANVGSLMKEHKSERTSQACGSMPDFHGRTHFACLQSKSALQLTCDSGATQPARDSHELRQEAFQTEFPSLRPCHL